MHAGVGSNPEGVALALPPKKKEGAAGKDEDSFVVVD